MPPEIKHASLVWLSGMQFEGGIPGQSPILLDGDNLAGPGPMVTLLLAAASCTGSDVVSILEKMRVKLRTFRIEVQGTRREEEPRRYVALHFDYRLQGEGLDQTRARRAIDLSIEKYCSVIHSLAPDIRITYDLHLT